MKKLISLFVISAFLLTLVPVDLTIARGMPSKHDVDGKTFGGLVSGLATTNPSGLVAHILGEENNGDDGSATMFVNLENNGGECEPCEPLETVKLFAGQDKEVGEVKVWNDGDQVCVEYKLDQEALDEGWLIYETHLFVGNDCDDIPMTRPNPRLGDPYNANPIPGQFPYGDDELEGVAEWSVCIPLADVDVEVCEEACIAAHAVIEKYETKCEPKEYSFESIEGDNVWGPIYIDPSGNIDPAAGWGDVKSAVEAVNNISGSSWVWGKGNNYNPSYDPDIDGVKWISTAPNTEIWDIDSWRLYKEEFKIPAGAVNVQGSVIVNADNEYWAYFNDDQVGHDDNIWNELKTHDFTPIIGVNDLSFIVKNWGQSGFQVNNPNGLTYKATITYDECYDELVEDETAWGDGDRFNEKGNWGMFFKYKICEPVEPCPEWIVYGSNLGTSANPLGFADTSSDAIFAIDLKNKTVSVAYDPGNLRSDQNYPNGNAYDPINKWLFFATDNGKLYFYDMVEEEQHGPFSVGGTIASGAWYNGDYYYVPQGSNNIYKVEVDKNSATRSQVGTLDRALSYGDIVFDINRPGVLFGSGGGPSGYYFTYDLAEEEYTELRSGVEHKQLAFASNGLLYGVTALTGHWYEIDPVTGDDTLFWEASTWGGHPIRLTDLADGPMCK